MPAKRKPEPYWVVSYWLRGKVLSEKQVQAKTEAAARVVASPMVHKSTRQLADKITAEPIGKWFDTFDLRTRAVVLPAGTMSAVLQAQGVELIVAPAKKKRPRKTRRK